MAFASFKDQSHVATLLQRSLQRGRLAHAYLFTGEDSAVLEGMARTLAKVLSCQAPIRNPDGTVDCCDRCSHCNRVQADNHPDVTWIRPESKLRLIRVPQIRDLLASVNLTPTEGQWKVAVICAADRMNDQASNALLKTLEEPPGRAVLILLSAHPERLLETVVSRCLRLRFAGGALQGVPDAEAADWLKEFAGVLQAGAASVLQRYQVLGRLLARLTTLRQRIEADLHQRSPLESQVEADSGLQNKWEAELAAAVEAEYRRQRAEFLGAVEWLFRDVWLLTLGADEALLALPDLRAQTVVLAKRFRPGEALENLRRLARLTRLLDTNAQEALVLEVGLLKLHL